MPDQHGNPGQDGLYPGGYVPPPEAPLQHQRAVAPGRLQTEWGKLQREPQGRPPTGVDTNFNVAPGYGIFIRCEREKKTAGGIALPEISKASIMVVKAFKVGEPALTPAGTRPKPHVHPGDYCLVYDLRDVTKFQLDDGAEFYILPLHDAKSTYRAPEGWVDPLEKPASKGQKAGQLA